MSKYTLSYTGEEVNDLLATTEELEPRVTELESAWDSISQAIYPVGAVYTSTVEIDPSLLFGGTWERIEGRFLLAADSTYTAGATGGEAEHLLTEDEAPRVQLPYADSDTGTSGYGALTASAVYTNVATSDMKSFISVGKKNEQVAHNNMPPYLAVYMWQRTA